MGNPAEIRGLTFDEQAGHRFNRERKRETLTQATGLTKRQHLLPPAIALCTTRPPTSLVP